MVVNLLKLPLPRILPKSFCFIRRRCDYSIIGRAKASERPDLDILASSTCHILPSKSCSCVWSSQVQGIYSRFSSIKRDYHQSFGRSEEMGTKLVQSLKHIHDPESISYISQTDAAAIDELLMGPLGFSVDQLMELAGLSVATSIAEVYKPNEYNRVLIICGPGNNGGDGLVAARHLYHFGYMPFVCYPRRTDNSLYHGLVTQLEALAVPFLLPDSLPTELASDFDIIVDAMFGFSFHGTPRPPFDALIHKLVVATASTGKNGGIPFVASVDIPSGWHVEEGDINDTGLRPDMLVSLTAPKLCARKFTGSHHFLGGRFVPPEVARKYSLQLPRYPATAMCVRIGKPPSVDVSALREDYVSPVFLEEHVKDDPIKQFQEWFEDAVAAGLNEPNAMALATTDKSGHPSVRMVLLKGVNEYGFVWYTNYESRKAHDILENPNASLLFFWEALHRQVRIEGTVEKVSEEESDEYFHSRPRGSQIGALVSNQSSVIPGRHVLYEAHEQLKAKYADGQLIPRPKHWGGYRLKPKAMEFWQGQVSRLHDRLLYSQSEINGKQAWKIERLAP